MRPATGPKVKGWWAIPIAVPATHAAAKERFNPTLKDFNKPKSVCRSTCGDGVVASDELCDGGAAANDGGYGHCADDCLSRGPYCGDHIVQSAAGEKCDDGENLTTTATCCRATAAPAIAAPKVHAST